MIYKFDIDDSYEEMVDQIVKMTGKCSNIILWWIMYASFGKYNQYYGKVNFALVYTVQ